MKYFFAVALAVLLSVNVAQAQEQVKIPGTHYLLIKSDTKCVAGTAFQLGGQIAAKFSFTREKIRGNAIVIIDPRLAGVSKGVHQGKIIWMFDNGVKRVSAATITSTGNEDMTYYLTAKDAALFPTASGVAFHVGQFLAGFSLDGAIPAVQAANRCAKGLR